MRVFVVTSAMVICAAVAMCQDPSPPPEGGATKLNLDKFVAEVDKNEDGCMSHEEWSGLGLPESSYNMLAKEGCVTKQAMIDEAPPDGIDLNGDGALTVAEMKEFDQKMSGGRGGPPPGPPPESE